MLQQTQVERVMPKYELFLKEFPNAATLAAAPLSKVLLVWSGLGYNRRAKYLHQAAKAIVEKHGGSMPRDAEKIEELPGVGQYTARAVAAFAFNKPEVFIETNIRTVFIHYFFRRRRKIDALIPDAEILPLVKQALALSKMEPREFYAALMDYGSHLKRQGIQLNARSKHYAKQSTFEGSERQLRGKIVKALLEKPLSVDEIIKTTGRRKRDVVKVIANLSEEGMITIEEHKFSIAK